MANQWDEVGFVLGSKYRQKVLECLYEGPATPSTIASETGIALSHVSRALQQHRDKNLVELLVPESRRKGRIYGITERGEAVYETIQSHGLD